MTRYEITATNGTEIYLVGYTPRVSKPGLLSAMQNVGEAIINVCKIGEDDEITFGKDYRQFATVNGWKIGFTGRTQNDAKTLGEHAFIAA